MLFFSNQSAVTDVSVPFMSFSDDTEDVVAAACSGQHLLCHFEEICRLISVG